MTEVELNLKLAKDIAQLRMVNMSTSKLSKTSLQQETVAAMRDLDARRESELITEINKIVEQDSKRKDHRVAKMFNKTYIASMQRKLTIRAAQPTVTEFSADDYSKIQDSSEQESLLTAVVENMVNLSSSLQEHQTVVPYVLYELYNLNKHKLAKAINNKLGIMNSSYRITKLEVTPVTSGDNPEDGIYDAQCTEYYDSRIYERFALHGIITVTINKIDAAAAATKEAVVA